MAESKFKQLQEEVCYKEPEEIPEPDKICPTCIPNENYTPPDWRTTRAPYLDESKCLYMIKVDINVDGDIYYGAGDINLPSLPNLFMKKIVDSQYDQNTLLKSYIRPAIRKALRYYNKLETDEIVCARPPINPGDICEGIHGVDYEQFITQTTQQTDEPIPNYVETISLDVQNLRNILKFTNLDALELFARVEDYDYLTNARILSVLIGIPAYKFDAVPQAPDLGSINTSNNKIVIKPPEFMNNIVKFKAVMSTFATYQAFFKQQENGGIYFDETGDPFYIRFFSDAGGRIDKFLERFEALLEQNLFSVRGLMNTGTDVPNIAYEIEISYDKADETKPFTIQNVRARKKNCPYSECSIGLEAFKEYSKKDQTMFGYIANMKSIAGNLSTNKTPPWIDFIVANTFPQLDVNYGSTGIFEDSCVNNKLQDMGDFILKETVDAFKAIEYRYNQNRCKKPEDIEDFNKTLTTFLIEDGSEKAYNEFGDAFAERARQLDSLPKQASNAFKNIGASVSSAGAAVREFISNLNPCDLKASMTIAMKCIMASLTAEEAYRAIIKQIVSSAGEEALEIILQSLPADQQQKIRAEVEKQFGAFPFPWEPGWEAGDLGGAVDRQARKNIEDKEERANTAEENSASLKKRVNSNLKRIEKIKSILSGLGDEDEVIAEITNEVTRLVLESNKLIDEREIEQNIINTENILINNYNVINREKEIQIERKIQDRARYSAYQTVVDRIEQEIETLRTEIEQTKILIDLASRNIQQSELIIKEKQISIDEINEARKRLEGIITYESLPGSSLRKPKLSDSYREALSQELQNLMDENNRLSKKKTKEDKTANDLAEYQNFSSLSEEEQAEMVEKQKEKTFLVKTTPEDRIQQGTLGRALGGVQKALTQAYIDEIMKTATIGDLQRAIENIPGSDLLGTIISQFKCPSGATVYPPIDSFLSTLTLDPCKIQGGQANLSLPTIQNIPSAWNWMETLGEAFMFSVKQIASAVLVALMRKAAELLNTDLCKLSGNLLRGSADGGFEGVVETLICDDPKSGDTRDKINQKVLEAGGARKRKPDDYKAVASVLSVSATQREIKAAMVGRADKSFLDNMSSIVSAAVPGFADVFDDPTTVANYFTQMGNLLTQEQRNGIIDQINNPIDDNYPVETSICLTKEEKDLWDQERIGAFQDPDLGRDFVDKQNEKALSDLSDAANILLNGPNGALEDALDKAFNPKDPDCKTNTGIIPGFQDLPPNKQKAVLVASEGIFKRLERAFIDDTVEANIFEIGDTAGILLDVLSDRANRNAFFHLLIKNNPFLSFLFAGGAELPETVGIRMKNQIDAISEEYKITARGVPDFTLEFSNGKDGNKSFSGVLSAEDNTVDNTITIQDQFQKTNVAYDIEVSPELSASSQEARQLGSSRAVMLKKLLEKNWSLFPTSDIAEQEVIDIYQDMNNIIYNNLTKRLVYRRDNDISEGFLYGREGTEIVEDQDLVYVDPEPGSTEYTYEEEDKVLGRSLTNNPRVHFLDPAKYGGTYLKPQIYIEEADHKGWLNFSKIVVPDPTGCDPKNSNFLMLDSIVDNIRENKSKIKNHESIQYAPECVAELPFDKVANSDTLATLEGIVKATIRVYLTEFMIQSYSIFSNVDLTDRNFDNTLTEYISDFIIRGLIDQKSFFASTYEGYTYMLLFLEQIVQIVHRKVRDTRMESNDEIEQILELCNTVQENYKPIMPQDMEYLGANDDRRAIAESSGGTEYGIQMRAKAQAIETGIAIIGSGGPDILSGIENLIFSLSGLSLERARFANKINAIYQVETDIKKLLKYLVAEEFEIYRTKLREEISPRPHIYDISKYFIGASGITLGANIDAGTFDTELPIGGGISQFPYGDVVECAHIHMNHPLDGTTLSREELEGLQKNGGFYLEKYIVCSPKEGLRPEIFIPDNIKGITSLSELKGYLSNYSFQFDQAKSVSEYFGDATLNETQTEYEGTIGIKYGVRLCYVPKPGFEPVPVSQENISIAKANRTYIHNLSNLEGKISNFTFPLASYEQDIIDVSMKELIESDENFNQELKCYVDKLAETEEFRHFMDNVITITKIPSLMMIYSFNFFLPSLGDSSERDGGDEETVSPDSIGKVMNDSKSEARKLFVSFYKNNDRDPPNEDEDVDFVSQAQKQAVSNLSFIDFSTFSFDIRRRLKRDKPFDKYGEECKNNFGKLFKIGGTS